MNTQLSKFKKTPPPAQSPRLLKIMCIFIWLFYFFLNSLPLSLLSDRVAPSPPPIIYTESTGGGGGVCSGCFSGFACAREFVRGSRDRKRRTARWFGDYSFSLSLDCQSSASLVLMVPVDRSRHLLPFFFNWGTGCFFNLRVDVLFPSLRLKFPLVFGWDGVPRSLACLYGY